MRIKYLLSCLFPLALVAPLEAQKPSQEAIHDALDRGCAYLVERFVPDKRGKRRTREREEVGMRALVLYAMLASGAAKDDPAVERLLLGLSTETIEKTYDVTCTILALSAHAPLRHHPWIRELAGQLIGWQRDEGDWGYPNGPAIDLSNTQYAALGLWKAARVGVEVPAEVWTGLAEVLFTYQGEAGGFSYIAPGTSPTGSMTAAGVGTLAICELELRRADALDEELAKRIEDSERRGLEWLEQHFRVDDNPRAGAWHYYYLYGLERMGGLTGIDWLGENHWYDEGARLLLEQQDEEGSWKGGTDLSETSFALLFLKRATSPEPVGRRVPASGGQAQVDRKKLVELLEKHDVLLGTGQRPGDPEDPADGSVHLWIDRFSPRVGARVLWPGEETRGPRVERVDYLLDGRRLAVVLGDESRPAGKAGFNARVFLPEVGEHEVTARVWVLPPPTADGVPAELVALESAPLEVETKEALPAWTAGPLPARPNLALAAKPSARASSQLKKPAELPVGEYGPESAIDGRAQTPWLTKPGDDTPDLSISYRKAQPGEEILIHGARLPTLRDGVLARPAKLAIKINGKDRYTLDVPEDPREPARLVLPEVKKVKRVTIELLELSLGEMEAAKVTGLGEVELFGE